MVVHRIGARLHHKHIRAAHVLENLKINLAVAEAPEQRLAQWHVQMLADLFRQHRIRGPTENFESFVVHDSTHTRHRSAMTLFQAWPGSEPSGIRNVRTPEDAAGHTTIAIFIFRAYLLREIVSQRKAWSCGNPTTARRAFAGLGNTPNTAEPLPASKASDAPAWSNARRILSRRGCRRKTASSKSFESRSPCALQHRAQNLNSLWFAANFVNEASSGACSQRYASGVGT